MERRAFQTPLGEVWLWGEREAFDGTAPVVFVIHGAFQKERSAFFKFGPALPSGALILAHLPGNHCPEFVAPSISAYTTAYDHVLRSAFPNRTVIGCGVSTGALVLMGVTAPNLRANVLIEPPLRTAKLWPLIEPFRKQAQAKTWAAPFVENIFGYYPRRIEDRDYTGLLERLSRPSRALVGDVPLLPERPFTETPSLVDDAEREALRGHSMVRVDLVPGAGHGISNHHARYIVAAMNKGIDAFRSVQLP